MRRLKTLHFKNIMILYSLALTISILFLSILLVCVVKVPIPNAVSQYYIKGEDIVIADNVGMISMSNLQKSVISASDLQNIFSKYYIKLFVILLIAITVIFFISSLILCYFLDKRIKHPMDDIAKRLIEIDETSCEVLYTSGYPKEFSVIENALTIAMDKMNILYKDFNNLSTYVSHEQKNSLSILRSKIQNGNANDTLKIIDHIVKNLDDILTICVHKRNTQTNVVTDLSLICGAAVDEYKKIYPNIQFDFDEEQSLVVHGNELWIYRAICNLLDNAIKFGSNTPIIVQVGVNYSCPFASVTDGGIGIDFDHQEKIFTNGYRIGNIKKDGYGIGLSLVKHVADLCNGFIWIDSKKGYGSTFKMIFPANPKTFTLN